MERCCQSAVGRLLVYVHPTTRFTVSSKPRFAFCLTVPIGPGLLFLAAAISVTGIAFTFFVGLVRRYWLQPD